LFKKIGHFLCYKKKVLGLRYIQYRESFPPVRDCIKTGTHLINSTKFRNSNSIASLDKNNNNYPITIRTSVTSSSTYKILLPGSRTLRRAKLFSPSLEKTRTTYDFCKTRTMKVYYLYILRYDTLAHHCQRVFLKDSALNRQPDDVKKIVPQV
jgi:hypothetical protein